MRSYANVKLIRDQLRATGYRSWRTMYQRRKNASVQCIWYHSYRTHPLDLEVWHRLQIRTHSQKWHLGHRCTRDDQDHDKYSRHLLQGNESVVEDQFRRARSSVDSRVIFRGRSSALRYSRELKMAALLYIFLKRQCARHVRTRNG